MLIFCFDWQSCQLFVSTLAHRLLIYYITQCALSIVCANFFEKCCKNPKDNCVTCYNNISGKLRCGSPLAGVWYNYEQGKSYAVDVIIDGEVLSVYLGGDIAITARITDMKNSNFAFYSNGAAAQIKDIAIYE